MKKKVLVIVAAMMVIMASVAVFLSTARTAESVKGDVEALSSCEVVKGHKTVYLCKGETEFCVVTYLGATLYCSGKEASR